MESKEAFIGMHDLGDDAGSRIRAPLMVVVVGVVIFLFVTQPEAVGRSVGLLAALTASGPFLFRLVGMFGPREGSE